MKKVYWLNAYLNLWRVAPVYIFLKINKYRSKSIQDLRAWIAHTPHLEKCSVFIAFAYLIVNFKECRNILLNRLHKNPAMWLITRMLFPPMESCYINMPPEKIGGGFSLQHGFATVVSAKSIGENCRIYQQVTVGFHAGKSPVIGDNVTITAGAIVIGDICIGDGACIGAGSVVTHDVAENMVVVGVPAREIRRTEMK